MNLEGASAPLALNDRDVRNGGQWTTWQAWKNAAIRGGLAGALRIADRIAPEMLLRLGRHLGGLAYHLVPKIRHRVERRLQMTGCGDRASTRDWFRNAGENLGRCLLLRRTAIATEHIVRIDERDRAVLTSALCGGRGAVLLSAHIGPFEAAAAAIADIQQPTFAVARESYDPDLEPVLNHHRSLRGVRIIHRGSAGVAARIVRALRSGHPIAFLVDLPSRTASDPRELLGMPWRLPLGAAQIAIRMRVPVLFGALEPDGLTGRFRLRIRRLSEATLPELTHRVIRELEGTVQREPSLWLGWAAD